MKEYNNHPLAEIFPMLSNEELQELSIDIKNNGLQSSIVLFEDKILDGRNRYAACKMVGIEPSFTEYTGSEPLQHIVSLNLHRRHLSESQRAAVAAKIANMERSDTQFKSAETEEIGGSANLPNRKVSQSEAAKLLNVSERSVRSIKRIMREAPEKVKEIEKGEKTINRAVEEIKKKEKPRQLATIDKGREKSIQHAINAINELKKIPNAEKSRPEALKMVKNWINQNQ